jgi:phosphoglycerate kinase
MKTIEQIDLKGKKALIRVDFNVPLDENFKITDDTRIKATEPTVNHILKEGGAAILMSHLGRPKGGPEDKFSLKHLVKELEKRFGTTVHFANDCIGAEAEEKAAKLQPGEILLLENLRFHNEETKGDQNFAQQLAKLGDIYINDAFGTAHRAHASTSIIAQYFDVKAAGYVMQAEINGANKILKHAERPFTAIMGGAKISDKILIIERLLDKVDNLLIGGGMTYTFVKAKGGDIGNSLLEEDKVPLAKELLQKAEEMGVKIYLPQDSVAADDFNKDANTRIVSSNNIPNNWMGLDIGPDTRKVFEEVLKKSKTILWNGPMGVFEMKKFAEGTNAVAKAVADATEKGAFSLIGGGDSAAAVNNLGYGDRVSYVSTGGGALLEYMEGKELPGVKALN